MTGLSKSKIGIIQITRLGDLIQTYQAAQALKRENPKCSMVLIARKTFANPLRFLLEKVFDQIHLLETELIVSPLGNDEGIEGSLREIEDFVTQVDEENLDLLINLSWSKSSAYLASIIDCPKKLGLFFDKNAQLRARDYWSQYVYSSVMGGSLGVFNLVDIYQKILGVKDIQIPQVELKDTNPEEITLLIHPFASHSKKEWNLSKWTEIIFQLAKDYPQSKIVVSGGPSDKEKISDHFEGPLYENYRDQITLQIGTHSIEELYNQLGDSHLFIGHDSMAAHLASIHKIPTVIVGLGTIRSIETTPYLENALILTPRTKCFPCFPAEDCSYFQCHQDIPYQGLIDSIKNYIFENPNVGQHRNEFLYNKVKVQYSCASESPYFSLRETDPTPYNIEDCFRYYYRILWPFYFEEKEEFYPLPSIQRDCFNTLEIYETGLQHLYELGQFGLTYAQYIVRDYPQMDKIKEHSQKIEEVDRLTLSIKKNYPLLAPVIDFFEFKKASIPGEDIFEMANFLLVIYDELSTLTSVLYDFTGKTKEAFKEEFLNAQK